VILADSSAWIEYDRATGSLVHRRLADLIAGGGDVAVTEPVVMEVLAGAGTTLVRVTFAACFCASSCSRSIRPSTSTAPSVFIVAAGRPASGREGWSTA